MQARIASLAVMGVLLVGCTNEPETSFAIVAVPTQEPGSLLDLFGPSGCPDALLEGLIVRHDDAGLGVHMDPNFPPAVVVWPHGWFARDVGDVRELLDASGVVVAREGDHFSAGGGFDPPNDWFHPCGGITFTPQG